MRKKKRAAIRIIKLKMDLLILIILKKRFY